MLKPENGLPFNPLPVSYNQQKKPIAKGVTNLIMRL